MPAGQKLVTKTHLFPSQWAPAGQAKTGAWQHPQPELKEFPGLQETPTQFLPSQEKPI